MQTAEFLLTFNSAGSHIPMRGVTPPEFAVLRFMHQANAGKHVVEQGTFKITGEKRILVKPAVAEVKIKDEGTGEEIVAKKAESAEYKPLPSSIELNRIVQRYGKKVVEKLFPGENPILPSTFSEVGVNDDGSASIQRGSTAMVDDGAGNIVELPIPNNNAKVLPPTDGARYGRGEAAPDHLAIAVGQ